MDWNFPRKIFLVRNQTKAKLLLRMCHFYNGCFVLISAYYSNIKELIN